MRVHARARRAAVYVAMLLAHRPGDCMKKEFKVNLVARNLNTLGAALNVVYISQQTITTQKPQVYLSCKHIASLLQLFFPQD